MLDMKLPLPRPRTHCTYKYAQLSVMISSLQCVGLL